MSEAEPLRRLLDAMDDAVCVLEILDPDEEDRVSRVRYLHANPAFERHTGYRHLEGTVSGIVFSELEPYWFEHLERAWRTGKPSRFVEEARALGRFYEVSLSRIGGSDTRQAACLFRDVTMQTQAQQRALQMAAELSEADRRKSEFLATLAHELRNPLAPIRSGLDLAEATEGVLPEIARLHAMMSRQVGQLSRLVDDLLDLSRISRDTLELRRAPATLSGIVGDAVEACRPMLEARGHALAVERIGADAAVNVDAVRLTQVLTNLLSNAVRYTPPGGHLALDAQVDAEGIHLGVSDDGEGLDAADLSRIFEMFTQVRGETPHEHGGLGIGLTLSQRIVELHGGELRASSPGRGLGSRFEVHLPSGTGSESAPALDAEPATSTTSSGGRATRILVVDDNRDAADTLAKILALRGHDAHVVYSGRGALEAIETRRPEVVFLDIGLPDITGYQVALELAGRDYRSKLALIALTGWGMARDRERSADAGFEHHLTKPTSARAVLELVDRVTASRDACRAEKP